MALSEEQALFCLGILCAATPDESKWTEDKLAYWKRELESYNDYECALKACQEVASTGWLPPQPRAVYDAYKAAVVRRELNRPTVELENPERLPHWRDGVEIARQAYHQECQKQQKEPKEEWFMYWLLGAWGKVTPKLPIRAMGRE